MARVAKIKAVLEGWDGAPGVNSWYFTSIGGLAPDADGIEAMAALIRDAYSDLKPYIVGGIRINIDPAAAVYEVETGDLVAVHGTGTHAEVVGQAAGKDLALSRATQINVRLQTDAIVGNRILAGRHFIGPCSNNALDYGGKVTAEVASLVDTAYAGMLDIAGPHRLVVWSQPKPARTGSSGKPLPAQVGAFGYVQSADAQAVPGTLRSRKV